MAIKFKKQAEPDLDSDRGQIYEDAADNHPKVKTSTGAVIDLKTAAEGGVFGSGYCSTVAKDAQSTNSQTLIEAARLETPVLDAGEYVLNFTYNWGLNSTNKSFVCDIHHRDVNDNSLISTLSHHYEEPKDPSSYQSHVASGVVSLTLGGGAHVFTVDYGTNNPNATAKISNIYISLWRVK